MFVFQLPFFGNNGSSREPAKEGIQDKGPQPITGRRSRAGFSDSFQDLDVGSLIVDDHNEDKDKAQQPQVQVNNKQSQQPEEEAGVKKSESSPKKVASGDNPGVVTLEPIVIPQPTGSPKGNPAIIGTPTTNKASPSTAIVASDQPPQLPNTSGTDALSIVPLVWRDFCKVFKKGPTPLIKKQNIPSLKKAVPKLTRRKSKRIRDGMVPPLSSPLDAELCYLKPSWKNFALWELLAATDNYSRDNLIGEGGYAEVYKGKLADGQFVAIKRLVRGNSPEEMTMDFLSELGIICHVDHPNIAKLIGYGVEGGMHLISDFGLARWLPENWTHHTVSKIEGTFGFTDVFAYGVLLLELITGRQAIDSSQQSLAKPLLMQNKISNLVDPVLGDSYNMEQMERVVCLAAMCVEQASVQRPQMSQAVEILSGDGSTLEEVRRRQKSKLQRTYSEELFDADEYNSTRYLSNLNIHLEDLLEPDDSINDYPNNDDDDDDDEAFVEASEYVKSPSEHEEENSTNHEDGDAEKLSNVAEEKSIDGDKGKSNDVDDKKE
ncbi:unnamed protein product [Linum tenue]|uniref:Protein kinase domain-containing protein n=1 Tax=Linum tenue TaxID=586396 RepID=A0AAV0RR90_9ROSI|nr:unnamed protein product [Linum tenue]